ncbi:hypothetical protein BDR04DRAFT_1087418 [Suillus decipiens]|nr:hypothetical protein BDR04DRAFT_1087418 [Suillus decipiens]
MMQVLSGKSPYYNMLREYHVIVAKSRGTPPKRPPAIDDVYWCYIEQCLLPSDKRPLVDEVLEYTSRRSATDRSHCNFPSWPFLPMIRTS